MFLLDSNCFIYIFDNQQSHFIEWFETLKDEEIALSSFVIFELEFGYIIKQNKKVLQIIEQMKQIYKIINYSAKDASLTAYNKAIMQRKGMQIDSLDLHIASQAINNYLTLITFNKKDFKNIPDLKAKYFIYQRNEKS